MPAPDPRATYQARLDQHREQCANLERCLDRIGVARLAVGFAGAIIAVAIFGPRWLSLAWLIAPIAALLPLSAWYARVKSRRNVCRRAQAFCERGLARIDEAWAGKGDPGTRFLDEAHLYAPDLDLFGSGSLFERLCEAHTRGGQDMLAAWLKQPAEPATVRGRQEAVAELRERFDLRERLALLGEAIPGGFETEPLAHWAAQPPVLPARAGTWIVHGLTVAVGVAALAWAFLDAGGWPIVAVLAVQTAFVLWLARPVRGILSVIERRAGNLMELSGILNSLESQSFAAPRLQQLQDQLKTDDEPPSKQIARLAALIEMLSARRNQIFIPFALVLMWGTRFAFLIEAWRVRSGPAVGRWLTVIAEMEALLSLAAYSFENPGDSFPEVVEEGPWYHGVAMRHPLMPRGKCVPNDLTLDDQMRLLVVSGSNMSGKSTWLRTVGINAVLALAGAPVPAERLRISPLAIGATLRIQDSLMAGKSRFYAEITRIQQIMEKAKGPLPLLFLFDEILHGTNSHDRGIGAEAIVRALVERGAIGLLTTHDLALAHIADGLAPHAANVHFADRLVDGQMVFDYRMQPGVVRHSNAIALMRIVGLPV
jgi:hypothetical protein